MLKYFFILIINAVGGIESHSLYNLVGKENVRCAYKAHYYNLLVTIKKELLPMFLFDIYLLQL